VLASLAEAGRPPPALLIAGPTASGKSALALALAERLDGEIVNADSMQVYRDLRVLSARPTPEEEGRVPHRLYGFVAAGEEFSVGRWLAAVAPVLAELRRARRPAIVTGGTGLYFRALTEGLAPTPPVTPESMAEVGRIGASGPAALHGWLIAHDPEAAARLSPADLPRLERAVSVLLATGIRLADWRSRQGPPLLASGDWRGFRVDRPRAVLYAAIDRRFEAMMVAGALEEARAIAATGLPPNRGVMKAHGLPHLLAHLRGEIALDEAAALGQRDTRNYAKRQGTWARRFMADWTLIGEEG
jgi:tRNA dimethylallyltransferase